ncbi:aspartate carbamoyltransferase [Patescibacteria group bacterium]|nr:aspartate carbamoyltransferase [Patescibacteria group bacterium]
MDLKHIVEAQQFDVDWLEKKFFPMVDQMEIAAVLGGSNESLSNKRMVVFFYEPSTRTRASFEIAMRLLGGDVVFSTENARQFSSVAKGESLRDTIRVLNRYHPHVIVLRYHEEGGAKIAADASSVPIINAGDGTGQHPTQALLDIYTIRKRLGHIEGIKVAMVGDLAKGRTVRSLSYLLGKYPGITIYFVAPEIARMREDIKDYLRRHRVVFQEATDLRTVAPLVDVIYQTRTQKERGSAIDRSDTNQGFFIVDASVLSLMKEDAIIMHPLPRNDEISLEVDDDPRAVYITDQVSSGLYTRMALLKMLLSNS